MISYEMKFTGSIEAFKKSLDKKCNELAEKLAEKGKEEAQNYISTHKITHSLPPSDISASIKSTKAENGISNFYTNHPIAPYIEFGTGIVGEASSHDKADVIGWKYDINNHGIAGWWYPSDGNGINPTEKYVGDKENSEYEYIALTQGIPSTPFMLYSARWIRNNLHDIVKEVFK